MQTPVWALQMIWLLIDSSGIGGAERHVATLAQSFVRKGLDPQVVLYADHGHHPWLTQLDAADLPVRVLRGHLSGLIGALAYERPRLVHTHGYKAGIVGRLVCRMLGIPVVSTFHAGERSNYPVAIYQFLDEWTSFLGSRIAVSDPIANHLPFFARVIPSFVAVPDYTYGALPGSVGFVGRLSSEKGPDVFCELAKRSPAGLEWHIFGDGPMRHALESEYGALIQFHGVVTDLQDVWPRLGLLLMPSKFEGIPLAALEALAAGVPVLATRVGGLPSIVIPEATGWLFEPGNIDDALSRLTAWSNLSGDRLLAMRKACRQHVDAHFSERVVLPRIVDVYRRLGLDVPMAL
jgi:glycosyltransferase involved in cell wall biosynthesis